MWGSAPNRRLIKLETFCIFCAQNPMQRYLLKIFQSTGNPSKIANVLHSLIYICSASETSKKATNPTVKGVRDIDAIIRMRILENHSSCAPETEQHSIKDAFKNHGPQYCRRGPHTDGKYSNEYERPPVELARACTAHG